MLRHVQHPMALSQMTDLGHSPLVCRFPHSAIYCEPSIDDLKLLCDAQSRTAKLQQEDLTNFPSSWASFVSAQAHPPSKNKDSNNRLFLPDEDSPW